MGLVDGGRRLCTLFLPQELHAQMGTSGCRAAIKQHAWAALRLGIATIVVGADPSKLTVLAYLIVLADYSGARSAVRDACYLK